MDAIPELVPISELRTRSQEILARLQHGAVILTHRGRAVAVLVSPQQWNEVHQELRKLEAALEEAHSEPPGSYYDFLGDRGVRLFPESEEEEDMDDQD